ncbi:forkhead box protein N1 isoform X2 [Sphaeramia orbicularis]|nr:forkhead box protein N1-like isoform X2 [Sphaeramia orbicularis]XP_030007753.1 forkhead box protein N1-like isoform X2 [Sphaeramia orbicularis]
MSDSPAFSPCGSHSQTSAPQASLSCCDPCGTSCQQMAEAPQEGSTFSLRSAAVNRRHSADGTLSPGSGSGPVDRFHPYRRQFSEGTATVPSCHPHCLSAFSCLQEVCSPGNDSLTHSSSSEATASWDQYNSSIQCFYPELPAGSVEPSCFLSQTCPSYSSSNALSQVPARLYTTNNQSNTSKYSLQSLSSSTNEENTTQLPFPKPIYSYSILIFMALRNSKTGSLPVNEIYSFMTEHFPYFKTAPDGWKNSVRHNLSLNKCFEKVENKNGNSSRKGCLWALNPAKVEKMQEELHKWRRKDPVTVRRSMAKPQDLDHLLGEKPDKVRAVPPCNPTLLSRIAPLYETTSSSCVPAQRRPPCPPLRRPQYSHIPPSSQQPHYFRPTTAPPNDTFVLYSPCGQQPSAGVPSATGSLDSHLNGKMPPTYSVALHTEYSGHHRSMQELLLDGDTTYDIDTLNPSLTDLQLHGNLWEELKEDSLVSDPRIVTTTNPSTTSALQDSHVQISCLQTMPPVTHSSEETAVSRHKSHYEEKDTGWSLDQSDCFNGLHPVVYSGMDSLAGYLTSCATSISLM